MVLFSFFIIFTFLFIMRTLTLLSFISIVKVQYDLIIILLNNRPPVIKKKETSQN